VSLAGRTPASVETDTSQDLPVPAQEPLPTRVPAVTGAPLTDLPLMPPVMPPDDRVLADLATKLRNKMGADGTISGAALFAGRPAPEVDLTQPGWRVPRYVKEAVRQAGNLGRVSEQDIVTEALRAYEPLRDYLRQAYHQAAGF